MLRLGGEEKARRRRGEGEEKARGKAGRLWS